MKRLIETILFATLLALAGCSGSGEDTSTGGDTSFVFENNGDGDIDVQICIIEDTQTGEQQVGSTRSLEACSTFGGIPLNDGDLGTIAVGEASFNPDVPFVENCSVSSQASGLCQPVPNTGSDN